MMGFSAELYLALASKVNLNGDQRWLGTRGYLCRQPNTCSYACGR